MDFADPVVQEGEVPVVIEHPGASAGNCAVGGTYDEGVFVAIEKNGVWGKETTVPGALRIEAVHSVSCASAGSCVAGGSYLGTGRSFSLQGFVT